MNDEKNTDNLPRGSIAWLDGSFADTRTAIKAKLKLLEVTVKTTFDTTVTHVLLGHRPPTAWSYIADHQVHYLTEAQLYPLIKGVGEEEAFLLEEEDAGESQLADNLKTMLTSPDVNTVQIALLMLKQGGLPQQLAEELLIVAKTNEALNIRTEARKLLLTQGPPEWVELLKDKQIYANIDTIKQKETRAKLEKTAKSAGPDAAGFLSVLFYQYFGRGLGFALSSKGTPYSTAALEALTNKGVLDFHAGIGYNNWKDGKDEAFYPSQKINTGIPFPVDHPDPLRVRTLNFHNCKIDKISNEVIVFANCEVLDASHNAIKNLHPSLAKLTKLRKLDLSFNKIIEFPAVLLKMNQLEELDLRNAFADRSVSGLPAIAVPEAFYQQCPHCIVLQ